MIRTSGGYSWLLIALASAALLLACDKSEGGGKDAGAAAVDTGPAKPDCSGEQWHECLDDAMTGAKKDPAGALEMLTAICEGEPKVHGKTGDKSVHGCVLAGNLMVQGARGVKRDKTKAQTLFDRACNEDHALGCMALAMVYQSGVTFTSEVAGKVFEPMMKACRLGNKGACPRAAEMKKYKDEGLPSEWPVLCKSGRADACLRIGQAHQSGEDNYKQDTAKAADFFRQACEKKEGLGCTFIGVLIADKQIDGKRKDIIAAFTQGCDLKEPVACRKMGLLHWDKKKFKDAVVWLDKACALDDGVACTSVGQLYVAGKGTAKDVDKGKAALDKACKAGEALACKEGEKLAK